MSQTETVALRIVKMGLSTALAASLSIPLTISQSSSASAYSFVKTSEECTQHDGSVKALNIEQGGITDDGYRYECDTPKLDAECVVKHNADWYFDAEFGQCEYDSTDVSSDSGDAQQGPNAGPVTGSTPTAGTQ